MHLSLISFNFSRVFSCYWDSNFLLFYWRIPFFFIRNTKECKVCSGGRGWYSCNLVLGGFTMLHLWKGQGPYKERWAGCWVEFHSGSTAHNCFGPRWADSRVLPKDSAWWKPAPAQARWQQLPNMLVRVSAQGDTKNYTRMPTFFFNNW